MRSRTVAMLALSVVAGAAAAQDSPLKRCRTMTAAAERLACYDAIPLTALPATKSDASASEPPKLIETSIAGRFTGWGPNDRIRFANGQTWQIIDGSIGIMDLVEPKVRIEREFIGGYHLVIDGTDRTPRVRRVLSAQERAAASAAEAPNVADEKIIETGIAGRFTGWWPKDRITMTNGQVWQIIDGSTGAIDVTDPKVKIRREFIGGYRLEIEGAAPAPRVQRVQ